MGCVTHDSHPIKSVLWKIDYWGQNSPSNSPWAHGTTKILGKERVHREAASFQSVSFLSVVLVLPHSTRGHKTTPCTKKDAPAEQHATWRKVSTSSKVQTKQRVSLSY